MGIPLSKKKKKASQQRLKKSSEESPISQLRKGTSRKRNGRTISLDDRVLTRTIDSVLKEMAKDKKKNQKAHDPYKKPTMQPYDKTPYHTTPAIRPYDKNPAMQPYDSFLKDDTKTKTSFTDAFQHKEKKKKIDEKECSVVLFKTTSSYLNDKIKNIKKSQQLKRNFTTTTLPAQRKVAFNENVIASAIPRNISITPENFKHNSTSSLYIRSSLSAPDIEELSRCVASAILSDMDHCSKMPFSKFLLYEVFNEQVHPIHIVDRGSKGPIHLEEPSIPLVQNFIKKIFEAEELDPEVAILSLAYIERSISLSDVILDKFTWRRVLLISLILASKVWEDQSIWNVDYIHIFNNLTSKDLNALERSFFSLLNFDVSMSGSLYASYYFSLLDYSFRNVYPIKPLSKFELLRLENRALKTEKTLIKRSSSLNDLDYIYGNRSISVIS